MISTKGRCALQIMLDMTEHGSGEWHRLSDVARRQQLSKKYLESIMAALICADPVESALGESGGYWLNRPPEDHPVGEILWAAERNLLPLVCIPRAVPAAAFPAAATHVFSGRVGKPDQCLHRQPHIGTVHADK